MALHQLTRASAAAGLLAAFGWLSAAQATAPNVCPAGFTPQYSVPGSLTVFDTPQPNSTCFCSPDAGNNQDGFACGGGPITPSITKYIKDRQNNRWFDEFRRQQKKEDEEEAQEALGWEILLGGLGSLGSSSNLGGPREQKPFEMHLLPGTVVSNDAAVGRSSDAGRIGWSDTDIFRSSQKGFGFTDSTGGSGQTEGFKDSGARFGWGASLQARSLFGLSASESLKIGGDISRSEVNRIYDTSGSTLRNQSWGGDLYARYSARDYYVSGFFGAGWGHNNLNDLTSGTALNSTFGNSGIGTDVRVGRIIPLWKSFQGSLKDGPATSGSVVLANISGHLGYMRSVADGFTDTAGTVYSDQVEKYWQGGARLKLSYNTVVNGTLLSPYIAGTVDRQFDYANTQTIAGTAYNLTESGTIWGTEVGVSLLDAKGLRVNLSGNWSWANDRQSSGARLSIGAPF